MKLVTLKPRTPPPEIAEFGDTIGKEIASGEVSAMAVVRVTRDGETRVGWAWDKDVDSARLIGGATVLQLRLWQELDL